MFYVNGNVTTVLNKKKLNSCQRLETNFQKQNKNIYIK